MGGRRKIIPTRVRITLGEEIGKENCGEIPITPLRKYYLKLKKASVGYQASECDRLSNGVNELASLFLESHKAFSVYRNMTEKFYENSNRKEPKNPVIRAFDSLGREGHSIQVRDTQYRFFYRDREISPLRTRASTFSDGESGRSSGLGGIDYIAHTIGQTVRPVLGEVKRGAEKTPYYAFIQLLTYFCEMSTPNQITRADRHRTFGVKMLHRTFAKQMLYDNVSFDLHIVLADYQEQEGSGFLLEKTRVLAQRFRTALASNPVVGRFLGDILCLKADTGSALDMVDLYWKS